MIIIHIKIIKQKLNRTDSVSFKTNAIPALSTLKPVPLPLDDQMFDLHYLRPQAYPN